jgi:hypothetical protein
LNRLFIFFRHFWSDPPTNEDAANGNDVDDDDCDDDDETKVQLKRFFAENGKLIERFSCTRKL